MINFTVGQPVKVLKGGYEGRAANVLEVLDSNYYYASVKTKFGNFVKVVFHAKELVSA
jgi:transcription antitermination factor NusG